MAQTQNQVKKVLQKKKSLWAQKWFDDWLILLIWSKYPIGFCYRIDQWNINGEQRGIKCSYGLSSAYLTDCFQVQS